MAVIEVGEEKYHVDDRLMKLWEKNSIEFTKKQNTDRVYIVDGRERSGKSYWTIQQMGKLEPELFEGDVDNFLSRVCFSANDFNEVCRNTRNGVVIFDEAFRGFSSRAALSKINKLLIQTLMEMGQNNNIVFIVLPSFFMLDVYPAMLRSDGMFHISEDTKTRLRKWEGFNRSDKNKLYKLGIRKGWNYVMHSKFRGRFSNKFPGGEKFLNAYLKKKRDAIHEMGDEINDEKMNKWKERFMNLVYELKEEHKYSNTKVAEALTRRGSILSHQALSKMHGEYKKTHQ